MQAAILNGGAGAWAFEEIAVRLAESMGLPVRSEPADRNYLLTWDGPALPEGCCFIPYSVIVALADKRRQAELFADHSVATPRTYLAESDEALDRILLSGAAREWVLKWPTGCGGGGHRLIGHGDPIPPDWPRPYLLQEFIASSVPEVYRLYGIAGETFGWNVRRFPPGAPASPFVAHARGANYEDAGAAAPPEAQGMARRALAAAGVLETFGCADLIRDRSGRWLVLEVNTEGLFSHIDRDIPIGKISSEIDQRLSAAFRAWASR